MKLILIKILLAHLLGDFLLQTDKMVKSIRTKKFRSPSLYIHGLIHTVLFWIAIELKPSLLGPAILYGLAHLGIDMLTKIVFYTKKRRGLVFIVDQVLHIAVILMFIFVIWGYSIDWRGLVRYENYVLVTFLLLVTQVGSLVINNFLKFYSQKYGWKIKSGNKNAGNLIGILERLFIFGFIVNGFWEGIGYLLAAKSIFRFGDLRESKEIQMTEYILIGTLMSFGFAIIISIIYLNIQ